MQSTGGNTSIYINCIHNLLIYDFSGAYIYTEFPKKYYFVDLYYILNLSNFELVHLCTDKNLVIYRVH